MERSERSTPAAEELPVAAGAIEARWYQSGGRYIVYFANLSLVQAGPICPGTSIETAGRIDGLTSGPTARGACVGAARLSGSAGVVLCGDQVLYRSAIAPSAAGTLHATIERYASDGTVVGVTSAVPADSAMAPIINLSGCWTVSD